MNRSSTFWSLVRLTLAATVACVLFGACSSGPPIDMGKLRQVSRELSARPDTRCLLVEQAGKIVLEEYYNGGKAETRYDVRSVTKSVVSLLFGIALAEGRLKSPDQTIGEFLGKDFPGLDRAVSAITVRQLLAMTSGIPWRELGSTAQDFGPFISSPDPLRWILERPLEAKPGELWNYNTGACHILSAILTKTTWLSARAYAQEKLFTPLGEQVGNWEADRYGYSYGGHGISLTASTMVKLGRLMLDKGVYGGKQVVPEDWARESTSTLRNTASPMGWGSGYGYLWWTDKGDAATGGAYFFATGYGGQFIVCVPSKNAVVVAVTEWRFDGARAGNNWYNVMRTIVTGVLPCLP
jgi:CubicO group peptidase (beta-lactamase class C family)